MKLRFSHALLFFALMGFMTVGVGTVIYGQMFNATTVFVSLSGLAVALIGTTIYFEKRLDFMDLTDIPKTVVEPKQDIEGDVARLIIENMKIGYDIKAVITNIRKIGYSDDIINSVFNKLIQQGIIEIPKPEAKAPEEKPKEEKSEEKPKKEKVKKKKTLDQEEEAK